MQHLDLDVYDDHWEPPASLIDRRKLKGLPPHGIGRSCKAGKEEIIGLLEALRLFVSEGDKARCEVWMKRLAAVQAGIGKLRGASITLNSGNAVPVLELALDQKHDAGQIALQLQRSKPAIHVDASLRHRNMLLINPTCFSDGQVEKLCDVLKTIFKSQK